MEPYERLAAWQECHRLALETYRVTESLPDSEKYGLVAQSRRAAFSAAANVVEGSARRGAREFRRFLDISHASLAELSYALRLARDLGMLPQNQYQRAIRLKRRASFLVWRLYKSLEGPSTNE